MKVIFRKDKENRPLAVFPEEPGSPVAGECSVFDGEDFDSRNVDEVMAETEPADFAQASEMCQRVKSHEVYADDDIRVWTKVTPAMRRNLERERKALMKV